MVIRQRAIQAEDKQERHDAHPRRGRAAAAALARARRRAWPRSPTRRGSPRARSTSISRARRSCCSRVHERSIDGFFRGADRAGRSGPGRSTLDAMFALTRRHLVDAAAVPAAGGALLRPDGAQHSARGGAGLQAADGRPPASAPARASSAISRHCAPGGGVALLRRSYALIIGLWQMSATPAGRGTARSRRPGDAAGVRLELPGELEARCAHSGRA